MEVERAQLQDCSHPFVCKLLDHTKHFLIDYFRLEMNNVLHSFRDSYKSIGESLKQPSNGMISQVTRNETMPEYNSRRLVLDNWSCSGVESSHYMHLVSLFVKGSGCQVTGILDLASSPVAATNWEQTLDLVPASILCHLVSS